MTIFGAGINPPDFVGINYELSKNVCSDTEEDRRRSDLVEDAKDKWNEYRVRRLDFINKRVCQKSESKHTSAMSVKHWLSTIEYLRNKKKPLPLEPQLSDFYHTSLGEKNGELLFVAVGTGLRAYL